MTLAETTQYLNEFDANADGKLELAEFQSIFAPVGATARSLTAKKEGSLTDANKKAMLKCMTDQIEAFKDIAKCVESLKATPGFSAAACYEKLASLDGEAEISQMDLVQMCKNHNIELKMEEASAMIRKFDANGDSLLSKDEFVQFLDSMGGAAAPADTGYVSRYARDYWWLDDPYYHPYWRYRSHYLREPYWWRDPLYREPLYYPRYYAPAVAYRTVYL